jgi:hypothetical protein
MSNEQKTNIVNEHFWFTATTIGVNGLAISQVDKVYISSTVIGVLFALTVYAVYLIVDRSAQYAMSNANTKHITKPVSHYEGSNYLRLILERLWLTIREFWQYVKHTPFIIMEFGSSLFYILLIGASFWGVWYVYSSQCTCYK